VGGEVNKIWVYCEVRQAAPNCKQGFALFAIASVLFNCIFDVLPFEWVFEFGGEDGESVEENAQVEAVFVLLTVFQLANDGKKVGFVEFLEFFVKTADGTEVSEFIMCSR